MKKYWWLFGLGTLILIVVAINKKKQAEAAPTAVKPWAPIPYTYKRAPTTPVSPNI